MYAVIFRAELNELDDNYSATAARMRERAMSTYGCTEFVSVMEGSQEIAISYWRTLDEIHRWKQDAEHVAAQKLGRSRWYKSYHVQVVEIVRESSGHA
jgi:heme-degrading monooxygenase HmoA